MEGRGAALLPLILMNVRLKLVYIFDLKWKPVLPEWGDAALSDPSPSPLDRPVVSNLFNVLRNMA